MVKLVRVVALDHCALVTGLDLLWVVVFEVLEEVEALAEVARRPLDPELGVDQEDVPHGKLPERVSDNGKKPDDRLPYLANLFVNYEVALADGAPLRRLALPP